MQYEPNKRLLTSTNPSKLYWEKGKKYAIMLNKEVKGI